jgi:hypothetical protein
MDKASSEIRSYFTTDSQSVSQSVYLGTEYPCGTCDQILLPIGMLLSEICGLVSVGRPPWREAGSAICSVITQWSKSRRTRNQTLLSHLRLPQSFAIVYMKYDCHDDAGNTRWCNVLYTLPSNYIYMWHSDQRTQVAKDENTDTLAQFFKTNTCVPILAFNPKGTGGSFSGGRTTRTWS